MKPISARSSLAPRPVKSRKPEPEIFGARSKSSRPRRVAISQWGRGSKSKSRGSPPVRTCWFWAASRPGGPQGSGRVGGRGGGAPGVLAGLLPARDLLAGRVAARLELLGLVQQREAALLQIVEALEVDRHALEGDAGLHPLAVGAKEFGIVHGLVAPAASPAIAPGPAGAPVRA